ncbi:MAG: ATP-binding protein [Bacteroidales bacterium]|nr:ATP-binding protein [Bacteroidales bacterium]MBO7572758.1 ATP-binding protein [Bacteroidales bacterium]
MYNRDLQTELLRLSNYFQVLVLTGPRQSGKTTLCKMAFPDYSYINLEDEIVRDEFAVRRKEFLIGKGCLIIDEAQNMPEIFSIIQVMVDENPDLHYIITGSNNFSLMQNITQSLAGRAALLTLLPLSFSELTDNDKSIGTDNIMLRGFYPGVIAKEIPPQDAYRQYYNTYLQRDIMQIMNIKNMDEFRRFVVLCAARVGTEFNASGLSNEIGVSIHTIQSWINVLEASYIIFHLRPFYRNIGKRLTKKAKIYFYDSGLVCYLLGIRTTEQLNTHPLRGEIFENMVVGDMIKNIYNKGTDNNLFFYRDKSQHEVDVIQEDGLQLKAYEIKSAQIINTDFYKNLDYFRKLIGKDLISSQIIYAGDEELTSNENGYINYLNIK